MSLHFIIILLLSLPYPPVQTGTDQQPDPQTQDISEGEDLLNRSGIAVDQDDYDLAMQLAIEAEAVFEEAGDTEGLAKTHIRRANILFNQQQTNEARELMETALERFPASTQLSQFHLSLGNIYMNSEPLKAVDHYNSALLSSDQLPEEETDRVLSRVHHNLALTYNIIGQRELAYQSYLQTITHAQAINDTAALTVVYNNLGMAYGQDEYHERARYYLEQSLEMALQRNSPIDMYRAYINLGNVFINTEKYEEALDSFNDALDALAVFAPGDPSPIVIHNMGRTLVKMQRYSEAEQHLYRALELNREQDSALGIYRNSLVLGEMYTELGRFEEAYEYLATAEELAKSMHNPYRRLEVKKTLHQLYASDSRYEDAYLQVNSYAALADSLNEAERSEELATAQNYLELTRQNDINQLLMEKQSEQDYRLNIQRLLIIVGLLTLLLTVLILYQMRKASREKEIILKQVELQKTELEDLNRSKDKLFAIISHDLRATLTSMQSILTLIKDDMLTDEEFRELIPLLEASVQENLNIMEDLLAWAQGQISEMQLHIESLDVTSLLEEAIHSQKYIANKKHVEIKITSTQSSVIKADYNAMMLVLRNLITNAIKFSNEEDVISISVSDNTEYVVIKVKDTGIGIPEDLKSHVFDNKNWTRKGTNNEAGTGFGLNLSKEFIERMEGRIGFTSQEGHGSTFFVEIPKY